MSMFNLHSGYNSVENAGEKFDIYSLGITFTTPWKIYLDLDMNYGGNSSAEDSSYGVGNTELSVGARWLEYGQAYDLISLDVVGGISMGVEDSEIGTERTDHYIGILTKKNFGNADLSLGFEYWFMDDDSYDSEAQIGGHNKYVINGGWNATRDIRFDLTFSFFL